MKIAAPEGESQDVQGDVTAEDLTSAGVK